MSERRPVTAEELALLRDHAINNWSLPTALAPLLRLLDDYEAALALLELAAPYVKEAVERQLEGGVNTTDVICGTGADFVSIDDFLAPRRQKPGEPQ